MEVLILQLFNGLSLSSILLLIALGLSITFGLMNVINMAHGELIMIGAYTAYVTQRFFSNSLLQEMAGSYFIVAILLSFVIAALIGWAMEKLLIRHFYGRPLDSLLVTWGVSLILQQLARTIFGAPNVSVVAPTWLSGGLTVIEGVTLPYSRIFIVVFVAVCLSLIYFYLYHSSMGRKTLAVMQNRPMAASLGVSTKQVDAVTFSIGAGLAGMAGCSLILLGPIGPSIGGNYIIDAFMVVVLGGVGKLSGTILGALAIGMMNTFFEFGTTASIGKVLVFLMIIVFLQWRPSGFIATKSRALDES